MPASVRDSGGGGLAFGPKALLVVHGGLAASYVMLWLHCAAQGLFWRSDFIGIYTGATMVWEGHSDRLYDLEAQAECQDRVIPQRRGTEGLLAFVYTPHTAVPLAPLAFLPWEKAFILWTLLQLALLVPLYRLLRRWTADWGPGGVAVAFVTVLAFPPLWLTFQQGQWSLLGLVCLLGFYDSLKRGRATAAAGWFVLGTFKPQLLIVPTLTLLGGRRWRVLGLSAVLFAAWGLLTTAVLGVSCWAGFVEMMRHCSRQFGTYGIDPLKMYNAKCVFTALLGASRVDLINTLTTATTAAAALATLAVWRGPWHTASPGFERRAALTLLLGMLANPHYNPADVLTLVAPAVFLGSSLRHRRSWPAFAALAGAAPLLFLGDFFLVPFGPGIARPFLLLPVVLALWAARCQGAGSFRRRVETQDVSVPEGRQGDHEAAVVVPGS
jgi:hypothetical protein